MISKCPKAQTGTSKQINKLNDNGDIMKMVHPEYFNYYGYYNSFDALQLGTWSEETLEEERTLKNILGRLSKKQW